MAKKPVKRVDKKVAKPVKKSPGASKPKTKAPATIPIEKACEDALKKLKAMKAELGLQADIEWCLGSYRHDKNPSGLYIMAEKALEVFRAAAAQKPKSVPAKLIEDLSKALQTK